MKIIRLDEVDSTNEYVKRNNFSEDTAVLAKSQSVGKGTKGRSFISKEGGIYLSLVRYGVACDAFSLLINACVAVCRTVERFCEKPKIRWANDVLLGDKKISGTLIENQISCGKITRSIVGIGLNVNNEIPPELKNIATSLSAAAGKKLQLTEVERELLKNLEKNFSVDDYKSYIDYFGKKVLIDGERLVTALDVDDRGRLIVEDNGVKILSSAEVTLRL